MAPISGKEKSLSIHIDTAHVGPNGMPLIYGSTPEKAGSFKGVVRFASNYDCKGRDIVILYEGKAVAQWTALENKKTIHHHTEEVFARQLWYFPLVHVKRSTVAAGVYEKEFQVFFNNPSDVNAVSTGPGAGLAPLPRSTFSAVTLLPSSSYGEHARVKYTIRAVLRRPFPSVTDVETSQEVWVLHSCLNNPRFPPSVLSPPFAEITTTNKVGTDASEAFGSVTTEQSDHQEDRTDGTSPERSTGSSSLPPLPSSPPPPPSSPLEHQASGHSPLPSSDPQSRSLLSLATPSKVLKSAIAFLPSIDLSRTRQFLSSPTSFATSTAPFTPVPELSCASVVPEGGSEAAPASATSTGHSHGPSATAPDSDTAHSLSSTLPSPRLHRGSGKTKKRAAQQDPRPDVRSQQQRPPPAQQEVIEYTGVWEPFQIPYNCSIPSEMVFLGQLVPLSIQFGPLPHRFFPALTPAPVSSTSIFHTVVPLSRGGTGDPALRKRVLPQRGTGSGRKTTGAGGSGGRGRIQKRTSHGRAPALERGDEDGQGFLKSTTANRSRPEVLVNGVRLDPGTDAGEDNNGDGSSNGNNNNNDDDSSTLSILKEEHPRFVVKKGILKVMEHTVLREVTVMPATTSTTATSALPPFVHPSSPTSLSSMGHRQGASVGHHYRGASPIYQEQLHSTSHPALDSASNATTPCSSPSMSSLSPPWSPATLPTSSTTAAHRPPTISEKSKNFFFKRRSLDQPMAKSSIDSMHSPTASTFNPGPSPVHVNNNNGSNININSGSGKSTKVISTIEAKFKTEVKVVALTPALRERELRYQEWLSAQTDGSINDDDDNGNDDDDEVEEGGVSGNRPVRGRSNTGNSSSNISSSSDGSLKERDASDFRQEEEQGIWSTTVWIQLPDASELATCTETKHILRTHTLQLILLCGVLGLPAQASLHTRPVSGSEPNTGRRPLFGSTSSSSSSPSTSPRTVPVLGFSSSTRPSANKEFRLEMDLHVTGPRAPEDSF